MSKKTHDHHNLVSSIVCSIDDIPQSQWDRLPKGNSPFWHYDFVKALERSLSTGAHCGWQMRFLVLKEQTEQGQNHIVAALPLWQKSHGMGEYVFDPMFAESWQHHKNAPYYPKLLSAIPFTPVRVPKLLAHETTQQRTLLRHAIALCRKESMSSLHLNFVPNEEARLAEEQGFVSRLNLQCHWHDRGYTDFDDFLHAMPRSRRKTIRKERASLIKQGFRFRRLSGSDLRGEEAKTLWETFYRLYCATYARKWGYPYFTREFFAESIRHNDALTDHTLLVVGERQGKVYSVALSFFDDQALYGRHWGVADYVPCLHFETCYYQSIDFALERKLSRVEAGTQGVGHKVPRGFEPELLSSVHFFSDPAFARAAALWCAQERKALQAYSAELRRYMARRGEQQDVGQGFDKEGLSVS